MNTGLSFKDIAILTLSLLNIYLLSPRFREFYEIFKKDIKEFEMEDVEQTINDVYGPYEESYYLKDREESDFSDISNIHVDDFDKFRKLFREI